MAKVCDHREGDPARSVVDKLDTMTESKVSLDYESLCSRNAVIVELCRMISGCKGNGKESCEIELRELEMDDLNTSVREIDDILALKKVAWYQPESKCSEDGIAFSSLKIVITY